MPCISLFTFLRLWICFRRNSAIYQHIIYEAESLFWSLNIPFSWDIYQNIAFRILLHFIFSFQPETVIFPINSGYSEKEQFATMSWNTIFMKTDYHFLTSHFLSSRTLIRNKLGLMERYRDIETSHWHVYCTGKIKASLDILLHITAVNFLLQKSTILRFFFSAKTVHGRRLFADYARVILLNSHVFTTSTHFYSQVEQFSTSMTVHWSA